MSNIMATIDGDIAHGRASVVAYHYLPTEQGSCRLLYCLWFYGGRVAKSWGEMGV